ncbi:hypothetical protein CsatB_024321 [Cannabis sativa]
MGQVFNKIQGKDWREKQIRKITDKVYTKLINQSERVSPTLTFEDLYIGECDMNLDGEINSEEFVKFIKRLTENTFITVSQGLILTLVVAPTVALATKRATEGVPGVGKVVQKIPNSIYASLITMAIVMFQKSQLDSDY